jgi:hypothetical protein
MGTGLFNNSKNHSKALQNWCAAASKNAKIAKNHSKPREIALPILPHPRFVRAIIVKVCLSCQKCPRKIRAYDNISHVK